jgi:flagellar biogenesis protein FliO
MEDIEAINSLFGLVWILFFAISFFFFLRYATKRIKGQKNSSSLGFGQGCRLHAWKRIEISPDHFILKCSQCGQVAGQPA